MKPIVVDLFCGGGGASEGIEMAGLHVDYAVNHDPDAIAMHEANHPRTHHFHRSVWDVSPRPVTRGRPVALLWGSPDCTHFSRAKGDVPLKKEIRDLAWVLADWAEQVRPTVIAMENVPEFVTWGPLHDKGTLGLQDFDVPTAAEAKLLNRPIPERKGEHFGEFIARLRFQGYRVEWRTLVAADYGAPTTRKRFFLVARCDGEPITWPEPTHVERGRANPRGLPIWRSAAECIDWTIPVRSIFGRKKPLAEATQRRIAEGLRRYVLTSASPFLVNLSHGGRLEPLDEPARTLTGAPLGTIVAGGAKHAVVSAWMAKHYGGVVGHDLDRPLGTVTTVDHHSLCTATLGPAEAEGARRVAAFLVQYYGSGGQWAALDEPMRTIVTKARMGLVTVEIEGEPWAIVDIGLRMLTPRELARAQGFPDAYDLLDGQLTLAQQIEKIGNSVCPDVPAALVRANITGERRREAA